MTEFRQSAFAAPPRAARVAYRHADGRDDPFHWLRDPAYPEVRDTAILDYLRAEKAYLDLVMGGSTAELRRKVLAELRAAIVEDDAPPPGWIHGQFYGHRYASGLEHPLWYRQASLTAPKIEILDANREAAGHAFYAVRDWAVSPDHRWLAILDDIDGSERLRLRLRDLASGRDVETLNVACSPGLVWAADCRTLFYIEQDDRQRPRWVRRHTLGTASDDPLVYEERDPMFFVGIDQSQSGRFLEIACHAKNSSEIHLLDLDTPLDTPRTLLPRRPDHEYDAVHHGDWLLIRSNDRHANFRVVRAPLQDPREANWQELLAGSDRVFIADVGAARDFWWVVERSEAIKRIRLINGAPGPTTGGRIVDFPDPAYSVSVVPGRQWDRRTLRLLYESPARARTWYDCDAASGTLHVVQATEIPGHDPGDYVVERDWAKAPDGVAIPLSLVRHRDTAADRPAPVLLYAYGAYGASSDAGFAMSRLPLLRRGVVWVIAHVRGGQEMGRAWYDQGKLLSKRNSFTDFIACAEHLLQRGRARPGAIAAMGGSAGGMLMGAIANMRPDLFGAIVARVPFVDVLSTMLDDSLPLTPPEFVEWGNPKDRPFYDYIRSYSPYDNVATQDYPPIYVSAGLNDPRVTYWEPAKWVARLRASKTDDNIVVLDTEMEAGHGGASGRYRALEEVATWLTFICCALRIEPFQAQRSTGVKENHDG